MPQEVLNKTTDHMDKTVNVFVDDLSRMRMGRATTGLIENIEIEYYGSKVPINQVAALGVPEPRLITIKPFEAKLIPDIERAIMMSDLGLMPSNDGKMIRVPIPQLTEERRKDLARQVKKIAEEARIAVRNVRRDANDSLKKMQKDNTINEDEQRKFEKQIQDITDQHIAKIDKIAADKEKDVLTV